MLQRCRILAARTYEYVIESKTRIVAAALAALLLASACKFLVAGVLVRDGASEMEMRTQDAIFTGLFCAGITWLGLAVGRFRRAQIRKQVKVVSDLNHHLRNAVEIILHSHLLPENAQTAAILESVERIDSALQVIVPDGEMRPASSEGRFSPGRARPAVQFSIHSGDPTLPERDEKVS